MKTNATYFVNDEKAPLRYGEINLINLPRQRLRGEEKERLEIEELNRLAQKIGEK